MPRHVFALLLLAAVALLETAAPVCAQSLALDTTQTHPSLRSARSFRGGTLARRDRLGTRSGHSAGDVAGRPDDAASNVR